MAPVTVPSRITVDTSTAPSMQPPSLTDKVEFELGSARTSPEIRPSRCRPPENSRSPLRCVVLPMSVSILFMLGGIHIPQESLGEWCNTLAARAYFDAQALGAQPCGDRDLLIQVLVIAKAVAHFALRTRGERRKPEVLLPALRCTFDL